MKRSKPQGEAQQKPDPAGPGTGDALRMPACKTCNRSALTHSLSFLGLGGLGLLAALLLSVSAAAQTRTWNINTNGTWNTAANWSPSGAPNGIGATAIIDRPSGSQTITLTSPITLGTLSKGRRTVVITAPVATSPLTFDATTGNASLLLTNSGSLTISAPVILQDNLDVSGAAGNVEFAGQVSGPGSLNVQAEVYLSAANTYAGGTNVTGASGALWLIADGAIPAGSSVTLGDNSGSNSAIYVSTEMTQANAFRLNMHAGSLLWQLSGDLYLSSFAGNGTARIDENLYLVGTEGDSSFAGTVSNTGNITKSGPSSQTFSGANTYSGKTFVSGGRLIAASNTALGTLVSGLDDATYVHGSGALGLSGGVTVAETLKLNGDGGGGGALQNLSGNTVLTGPVTLGWSFTDIGNPANSVTAADATIDVASGTTLTMTGPVDGAKALIKTGTGTLTLTGAGSWTGGTTVSAGTLRGDTSNLQGEILNNAVVVFDQTSDDTFGGTITGSGQVVKQGAGTLTLMQPRLWTGGTVVLAGALQGSSESFQGPVLNESVLIFDQATDTVFDWEIAGSGQVVKRGAGTLSLAGPTLQSNDLLIEAGTLSLNTTTQGSIEVLDGARLGGTGQAEGAVVAQDGVIAPGNSIGTLTLATLDTSGIYEVEYRAPGPGASAFLASGTGQSIRGRNVLLDPGLAPADQDADLLHVTGLAQLNPGSRVVLRALGSAGTFDTALSDPANTNGELRYLILRADGGLEGRFVALSETGARLDYLPEASGAQDVWLVLRDLSPVVVTGAAPAPWVLPMMTDDRPACDPAGASGGRCAFVQGAFGDGGLDAAGAAAGTDWSGWQGIVGAGQEVADGVWLGFGLGQWSGDLSRADGGATGAEFDRYGGYLWGTYAKGPLDLRGWIGFGQDEVRGTRQTALGSRPTAEFDATQSFAAMEARRWFAAGQEVSVTPLLALSAGRLSQDGYSETGGGVENFTASAQSRTSLRSLIGVEGEWRAGSEAQPVSLTASVGWGHEFGDTGSVLTGTYAGDVTGTVLSARSAAEDRNRLEIGLGGVFRVTDRSSLHLGYELSVADSSTRQAATARWSVSF